MISNSKKKAVSGDMKRKVSQNEIASFNKAGTEWGDVGRGPGDVYFYCLGLSK